MAIESHINTFNKGMTKDYNILYQPDGTYRHCVNCSLVSQDGNNYVIKDCLGNVRTFTLNTRYAANSTTFDVEPTPIGFISFPDTLVVFLTNNATEVGGYGEIGRIDYLPYGEGVQPLAISGQNNAGYTPLYHHRDINFTILQQIEGFAFQENDLIKRVYWTDDFNEPRVIDIGNPIFTTYIASGALVVGQDYMVLEGVITHDGVDYGPTNASGTIIGNIFTAVNANYISVTGTAPTPKVIQYFAYQLLNFTPSRLLGNIEFTGYGTGNKYCGNKMYFYRLTSPTEGIQTSWSYGTFPVPVRLGGVGSYFTDFGGGTPTTLVDSGKSVLLQITDIDINFERIQIAIAEFDQLLEVPRVIGIVIDEPITGSLMDFEDDSSGVVQTLTLSDLTLFPASILRCKTMTTNKNYNLVGNIQERGEVVFDKTGVTIEEFDHPIPAHRDADGGTAFSCPNVQTYVPLDYDPFNNPSGANAIMPYTTWVVLDDVGGPVVYNGNNYNEGEVFTGVPAVFTVTIPVGSQVRACVFKNKYTTTIGDPKPDISLLTSGYWDFKDPTVATTMKGYWDTEKYRLGILFYDLKGNPFYVRHLIDIDTTRDYSINPLTFDETDNDSPVMYINQKLLRLSGITLTPALVAKISGFSIVRVERDARIMTQGFLMQSSLSAAVIPPYTVIQPACSYQLNLDALTAGGSIPRYYSFICPDSLVDFPIQNYVDGINLNATSIEEAYWVRPRDQSGNLSGVYLKSVVGLSNEFETKYFETLPGDSDSPRTEPIRSQFNVVENGNLASFGNTGIYYQNRSVVGVAGLNVDNECFTGVPNSTNNQPANSVGIGGPRTILELTSDTMTDRGAVTLYSDFATSGIDKMMVNIVVSKDNPYGGNSDAALAANTYISIGHFQPINSAVLADTIDSDNYVFNDIEVAGGDCFGILCDYGYGLYDDTEVAAYSWGIKFPCQCNTNYGLRNGVPSRKVAPDLMHSNAAGNGIFFRVGINSQLEQFQYNQGYSSEGNFLAYPALPLNFSSNDIFRYRIRFGGQKIPGEIINTFRTFLINDYKDTDGQGGEINNLRTKDGKTIVWQNAIISTVPILERQLISGLDGAETTLGTGGVVDRFDPINSYFGNQHQWGLTATEFGFVWFDMRRKAVVVLDFGSGISEISMVEGLKGFFDEVFLEVIGNTSVINNNLLNDPTFSKYSDRPLTGVGICGVYDPKFKMTYLTFKFIQRNATEFVNKDFTVGYWHPGKTFIGFYDWTPGISWNHNQIVLSANNPKNKTKYYGTGMASTLFAFGDVVGVDQSEYIVINTSGVTVASYPGTGGAGGTNPVTGTNNWRKINTTNEIWVHNQPAALGQNPAPDYLYSSFFGQVVSNELQFVVNPKLDNSFSVLNMEQEGNNVNFTDITISGTTQSASDAAISSTSRFYRVIYDKITSNMPLSSRGRITDSFLLIRGVKKNYTTDPGVVSVGVKILRFVRSFFEQKR